MKTSQTTEMAQKEFPVGQGNTGNLKIEFDCGECHSLFLFMFLRPVCLTAAKMKEKNGYEIL